MAGRLRAVSQFAGTDNSMRIHRRAGEIIALFFFLHPFLIVLPRFWLAPQLALDDLWLTLSQSEAATGTYAWTLMGVFVLVAMYKDKLKLSYEAWRISHAIALMAVAILATIHAVTVGRHGVYNSWFDAMWILMCTAAVSTVAYTFFVRPFLQKRRPFKIVEVKKEGSRDWGLTIEKDGDFDFDFSGGQFVWLNTTGNPFSIREHPFSIASSPTALPKVSFVIRELGDYTSKLDRLQPGQRVYVDGPYGDFTLHDRKASGIAFVAGGCGIAAAMGVLRHLCDTGTDLPVRLIYGNRNMDEMIFQDEMVEIGSKLPNFKQVVVLADAADHECVYQGVVDKEILAKTFDSEDRADWIYYVCGPELMVESVVKSLGQLGIPNKRILRERLSF